MNTKGFRRILLGESMPDKNDPQYKEKYERDVNAGRKFAKVTRLDKLAANIQCFANKNKILFLVIVFSIAIGTFTFNIYRLARTYRNSQGVKSVTEMQDSLLRERHKVLVSPITDPQQIEQQ